MSTTMHFGPEWMRTKQQTASRPQPPPSPPPINSHAPTNASTYSALVSPAPPPEPEERDETHPFRYSKEEMLRIYKEGGGRGGLGLEVERWDGVVREVGSEPIGLREMNDVEKKLFAGPLNSDIRRRQSTDYLSPLSTQPPTGDRSRFNHGTTASGSPMRERFSSYMGKRRESTDPPPLAIPRKQSLSSGQSPLASPRDATQASPRTRIGFGPSFDGVLSGGGDSWMARRKAAEGLSKSTSGSRGDLVGEVDSKAAEIQEEEKSSDIAATAHSEDKPESNQQPAPQPSDSSFTVNETSEELASQTANMNISGIPSESNDQGILDISPGEVVSAPPPTLDPTPTTPNQSDLANVEWSYLDPQGNVQGPFLAHIMQNWYEVGYFAPDLLTRRTHIDNDWVPVGELARRAGDGKLFLSLPIVSTAPPGLSRHTETPLQPFTSAQDQNGFGAPYQPVPTRSLRPSTLDSYLNSSSNPSDSPSSSFGAGRFSNNSPDPATFGGHVGNSLYTGEAAIGGRTSGYSAGSHQQGRGAFNEPSLESSLGIHSGTYGNVSPGRASSVDNYGFNGGYNANQTPWPSNVINSGQGFDSVAAGRNSAPMTAFTSSFDSSRPTFPTSAIANQSGGFGNRGHQDVTYGDNSTGHTGFPLNNYNTLGTALLNQPQSTQYPGNDNLASHPSLSFSGPANEAGRTTFGGQSQYPQTNPLQYGSAPQHAALSIQTNVIPNNTLPTNALQQSPWDNVEQAPLKRPGPFDPSHPKASNTVVKISVAPSQPSPWARSQSPQSASQHNEASPWYAASQRNTADDSWRAEPGPNSLTFDNVGAHNQQHEAPTSEAPIHAPGTPAESQLPSPAQPSPIPADDISPTVPEPQVIAPTTAPKSKRKSAASKVQPVAPPVARNPSPSPVPATSKPAWSTEDDSKVKPSTVGLGLREIQEAEAKRMEAKKASERERERAARVASSTATPSSEDISFTASWGLPSSRAGARNDISPKESPVANTTSSPPPNVPVWTSNGKPQTKKSMKEILEEEEERRKKLGAKEAAIGAAARRGYAGTTDKVAPTIGGAWTTVGATGKAPPPTARPSITPSTSSGSPSTVWTNGPSASRPAAAPKPKVDEPPTTPSHEFLKWLGDSLKGLNSTVNYEDITSMLLSFPVDPDPSTTEIISDLIYANSTTLDGRRFAAEFVNKRKADVASRRGTAAAGKPVSIADIVKTQPKPTQPEWGGFKVVNKKKKGGRS